MLHPLPAAAASAAADTDCNQAAHQTATAMTKKAAYQNAEKLAVPTVSAEGPALEGPALAKAELFDVPLDVGSKPVRKRSGAYLLGPSLVKLTGQPYLADCQFPQQLHDCQASRSPI